MDSIKERRQRVLEKIVEREKRPYYSSLLGKLGVNELNKLYGLKLSTDDLKEGWGEVVTYLCMNLKGYYGHLYDKKYNLYHFGFSKDKLLANLMHGRSLSDEENKRHTLPDAVKGILSSHVIPGSSVGLATFPVCCLFAIDTDRESIEKIRNRKLTRSDYEGQLLRRINGANNQEQTFILGLYLESIRNGQYFEEGSNSPKSFPSWNKEPTKELTPEEWEKYKRTYLNPQNEQYQKESPLNLTIERKPKFSLPNFLKKWGIK